MNIKPLSSQAYSAALTTDSSQRAWQQQGASSGTPKSWGTDVVNISAEARNLFQKDAVETPEEPSVDCLLTINGQEVDVTALLEKLRKEDPEKYKALLESLSSDKPEELAQALSDLTGFSLNDVTDALGKMDTRELALFSWQLGELTETLAEKFVEPLSALTGMPFALLESGLDFILENQQKAG